MEKIVGSTALGVLVSGLASALNNKQDILVPGDVEKGENSLSITNNVLSLNLDILSAEDIDWETGLPL